MFQKKRQIQPIHAGPLFKRLHVVDEQLNNVKTEERNQSLMRHAREKETHTNDYFMIFSLEWHFNTENGRNAHLILIFLFAAFFMANKNEAKVAKCAQLVS